MIASHNTFTYLTPKKWWMRLFTPFVKCQNKDFWSQNADIADIRLRYYQGVWRVSHGLVVYPYSADLAFHLCKDLRLKMVRILVYPVKLYTDAQEAEAYENLRAIIKKHLSRGLDIRYGRLYHLGTDLFGLPDVEFEQSNVGSMSGIWYGKICPRFFRWMNKPKHSMEYYRNSPTIYSFDFL